MTIQQLEAAVLGATFGAVPVLAGFVGFWWCSIFFVPESAVWCFALLGLVVGLLVDALFLRRWVKNAYSFNRWTWILIYGFYSVGLLGFCMGVPIFNLGLAVPAGVFVGRWLAARSAASADVERAARHTAIFTSSVLALVCGVSASIALTSPSTPSDLQHMLAIPFLVTEKMVVGLVMVGGSVLLLFDWWLTIGCVKRAYGFFAAAARTGSG